MNFKINQLLLSPEVETQEDVDVNKIHFHNRNAVSILVAAKSIVES